MRKAARGQDLPPGEVAYVSSLKGTHLKSRCYLLFQQGWPATAIARAVNVSPSTVRNWVASGPHTPTTPLPFGTPALPTPTYSEYVPKKPANPGITLIDAAAIEVLAPLARRYRSTFQPSHPAAQANAELTRICVSLYQSGVPLAQIASVAQVSYRAMHRRVTNAINAL